MSVLITAQLHCHLSAIRQGDRLPDPFLCGNGERGSSHEDEAEQKHFSHIYLFFLLEIYNPAKIIALPTAAIHVKRSPSTIALHTTVDTGLR